jgi:itaconate CoA-transferase
MDAVPGLGQHTDSILAELGWRSADIEALHSSGAI